MPPELAHELTTLAAIGILIVVGLFFLSIADWFFLQEQYRK